MNKIFAQLLLLFSVMFMIFISCKKEYSCENCVEKNRAPIADAGPNKVITLPIDSISADGSGSNDPDGTIISYLWTKISGPPSAVISAASSAVTKIKDLKAGFYQLELKVTDNDGLSARDTMSIIVDSVMITNHPPVANAGADQTITLPVTAVTLDGSSSFDPDNNIGGYSWSKISGPVTFNIVSPASVQTQITNLAQGVYQFELRVTDAGGLFSKDTVKITVNAASLLACDNSNRPTVNAQLLTMASLPSMPWALATIGNKIAFVSYDTIYIYDLVLNLWSKVKLNLSLQRYGIAVIGAGNKIFFVGGEDGTRLYNVVDIYDISTNSWTVSQLSRVGDAFSTATCGNKVFFTGGNQGIYVPNIVDIYDLTTNNWSVATLTTPRNFITAISSSNKVYFTGGDPWLAPVSNVIDIYDNVTNTWSTSSMQFPRVYHAGTEVNDILYFAGGNNMQTSNLCSVETLNTTTGDRTLMNLFGPAVWATTQAQNAIIKNNRIIYLRHNGGVNANKFDIYDIQANSWSIGVLPQPLPSGALVVSVNNLIFIAGGDQNNQVWKLEF